MSTSRPADTRSARIGYVVCDRPNHWNLAGRSCTHAPSVVHLSASRNATIVARVTTIDGNRRYATSDPLRAPSAAPPAHATTSTPNIGTPAVAETPARTPQ